MYALLTRRLVSSLSRPLTCGGSSCLQHCSLYVRNTQLCLQRRHITSCTSLIYRKPRRQLSFSAHWYHLTTASLCPLTRPQLDTHKYTRKNPDVKPFDAGGDVSLEFFAQKSNCSLFALGSHSKKRPNNIILGRMHDFHLYDAMEFGVDGYAPISQFAGAGMSQIGNKVRFASVAP